MQAGPVSRSWISFRLEIASPRRAEGADVKGKGDELISLEELEAVLSFTQDAVCYRCKVRFKDHSRADHLFFEHPDEAPEEESN
jgi:hypothetical protein